MSYQRDRIMEVNPDAILWDELDSCIIGITDTGRAVYDIYAMEIVTQKLNDWEFVEASEWVEYNILQGPMSDFSPVHIWVMPNETIPNETND
jgi:hypothetical protein